MDSSFYVKMAILTAVAATCIFSTAYIKDRQNQCLRPGKTCIILDLVKKEDGTYEKSEPRDIYTGFLYEK